jgi:hypothetical protein
LLTGAALAVVIIAAAIFGRAVWIVQAAALLAMRWLASSGALQGALQGGGSTPDKAALLSAPMEWTPETVALSAGVFFLAGLAEIGGGWLVWQAVREGRPWWWGLLGSAVLVLYGFIPCAQPTSDFGRIYGEHLLRLGGRGGARCARA